MSALLDYCTAGVRVAERSLVQRPRLGREERLVFVVGCPRSGTTFVGRAIGGLPGFVDFGEVTPWKAALPEGPSAAELRTILERIRRIGLAWGLRGVEQTPETAHVLDAALEAYPEALAVHALRDGRDVVCSLLERGWLNAGAEGRGRRQARVRVGAALLGRARAARGVRAGERRAALRVGVAAIRRGRARAPAPATACSRSDTRASRRGRRLAEFLGSNVTSTHRAMDRFRDSSIGRWRKGLSPEQLADVEAEAGPLLAELGYTRSGDAS